MSVIKQNSTGGFIAVAMALSAALSPTAIAAQAVSGAPDDVQIAPLFDTPVILRYGANIENVGLISGLMEPLGISVTFEDGFTNPECGQVQIGNDTLEFSQGDIYNGRLGFFIKSSVLGGIQPRADRLPSCDDQG